MAFNGMLNHKCDIYHMKRSDVSPGYGLPESPSFSYHDTPDISGVSCHFHVRNGTRKIVQQEPQTVFEVRVKMSAPFGADIRFNDKIVSLHDGIEYTADVPIPIRDHHIIVWLRRTSVQEAM